MDTLWDIQQVNQQMAILALILYYFSMSFISALIFFFFFNYYLFIYLFIYLFLAVLGPRLCARASSSCGKRGPLLITVHGPLSLPFIAEHRLQTHRLSSCGSRAQSLRGMWDPPRPGLKPMSPAPAGRLPTTAPPGKPSALIFIVSFLSPNCQSVCVFRSEVNPL